MKNYVSKIKKFKVKNYISNFRNKSPFNPIISSIILVFLLSLYFTIPTFYNYENFDKEILNFIQVCPKEMLDKLENPIILNSSVKEVS